METQNAQLEVLLFTGATFFSGNMCEKDDSRRDSHSSGNEQLVEGCWNGLLQTILPEIFGQTSRNNHLYLWELKATPSFLELELGEAPAVLDCHFSITAASFLSRQSYN